MKPLFNCSQSDFILVTYTALDSFHDELAAFTLRSPKYVLAWETTMRTDLGIAEAMPIEDVRDAEQSAYYADLLLKAELARNYYQRLKGHITNAFPDYLVDIKLQAAGQKLYDAAGEKNWPSLLTLLSMSSRFIAANLATLTANDEMPLTFKDDFDAVALDFKNSLLAFQDYREQKGVDGQARVAALNDIHLRLMPMMTIGQDIFKNNEAVRTQFVFKDVLARVGGHGLAGAEGKVIDNTSGLPIATVAVKLVLNDNPEMEYNTTTNDDGDFTLNCPSGTYTMTFIATGYVTKTLENVVIEVGTMKRVNEKLSAV